jgi:glycosyltransferase involved in cell wall biosynthesis
MSPPAQSVTLAICCYNAADSIAQVLGGVGRLSPPPAEVLVVDDGSTDESPAIARAHGARVVEHGRNRGLAAARNTCLERASGEIIIFIDADAVPHRDLVQQLAEGYQDPWLAGIGGQVLETNQLRLTDRWRGLFWRQTQGSERLEDAPRVVGACCSFRRQSALAAGGFSPRFRTNGEDVELSSRLRRRGHRLAYNPEARVDHLRRDSLVSLLAMIHRHSRDHVLALRTNHEPCGRVVSNALRWGPVTLISSLHRHRSAGLAALSPLCYGASLSGCALGMLAPRG